MSAYNQSANHFVQRYKATGYSLKGLKSTYQYEQAFRLEVYLLFLFVPLALWLGDSLIEIIALVGIWLFVMVVELLNSAIEAAIDRIGPEKHELSGRAKDIGSAAVMVSVLMAVLVWLAVLLG